MNIEKNAVVSIHYTLTNDNKEVIDSSREAQPLVYIQGMGQLISGLENELEGKTKSEKLEVTIAPKDGYGTRNEDLVRAVAKSDLPDDGPINVGVQFEMDTPQGPIILTVSEVKDDEVILDGNHPLADMNLHFDVEIMDVRQATAEELEHGHVHGPGCQHH